MTLCLWPLLTAASVCAGQYCNCADYWRAPSAVMRRLRDRLVAGGGRGVDFCQLEAQGTAQLDLNTGLVR